MEGTAKVFNAVDDMGTVAVAVIVIVAG